MVKQGSGGRIILTSSVTGNQAVQYLSAYAMTKALWAGLDHLVAAHPVAKAIDLKRALDGMPVPLHPGAEKYYREVRLIK